MKRSTKKVLGLAAGGVLLSGPFLASALGNTFTWTATATLGGQDSNWFNTANWSPNGTPGASDLALIPVKPPGTTTPPTGTISVGSNTSVGGIFFDNYPAGGLSQSLTGSGTITLSGQTMTIPQFTQTLTQSNVVLATGLSTTASTTGSLTVSNPLALSGAQNYFVGFTYSTNPNATGDMINLNGAISDAGPTPAQEVFYGGGTRTRFGAQFTLNAANTVTGGIVMGNTLGTEGAVVSLLTTTALPSTGTITINEQSQLLFSANGTYGTGMTMLLNGPGVGPGISGGQSGALRTGASNVTWAGNLIIGSATSGDPTLSNFGQVVISATGSNTLNITGAISGTGFLSKQGGGLLIINNATAWTGSNGIQNGNGTVQFNAGAGFFGDIGMYASSNNKPIDNFYDTNQGIRNLFSNFVSTAGTQPQLVELGAAGGSTVLTINQTISNQFGYKNSLTGGGLTTNIVDGPSSVTSGNMVVYHGNPGVSLTLTGPNTYSGGTQVTQGILNLANGVTPIGTTSAAVGLNGSALGSGAVTVSGSGVLTSGGGVQVLSLPDTIGGFTGNLTVNSGGTVSPGGTSTSGLTGTLDVGGNVTANAGSNFDFNLAGGDNATNSLLAANGTLTLDNSGNEKINVFGSKLAVGTYDLFNFNGGISGTLKQFMLGTTPGGNGRSYSLSTLSAGSTSEDLIIVATNTERFWSVPSGALPSASTDGSGTWQNGSTTFYNDVPPPGTSQVGAAYDSNATGDVVFGSGGAGGTVTLTGAVTVNGSLSFESVTAPYTIASNAPANTLTLVGGIGGSASANITAPIVLQGSQQFTAGSGTVLSVTGGISESAPGTTLTVGGDIGTLVLGGTNTYTGGTVINLGTLQTSTGLLPVTGGAQVNGGGNLAFSQSSNGTYTGTIGGTGNVSVNSTATVALAPASGSNTYSGSTNLQAGVLSISSPSALGTGAGGINFTGGTLQFTTSMNFPVGSPAQTITLASGSSDVDAPLSTTTVTMNQALVGSGNLNKSGAGTVIFVGLPATTVIGQVGISGGNLEFNPGSNTTYGFGASTSPGTFVGNLLLAGSLEVRLQGGLIDGGGNVQFLSSGINFISHGVTTVNNTILLSPNNTGGFVANLGATNGNTLTINSAIIGNSDVDFTGGAGDTYLNHSYASGGGYTGNTTIDNGGAGAIHLAVNDALPTSTDVHITSSGVLDVDGTTDTIGSLDSGGPGTLAKVENTSLNPATLIINGSKSTNFAGFISDNVGNATPGGPLTIELGSSYTGTLELNSGTYNTYNGGTVINGGTLLVDTGSFGVDGMLGNSGGVTFGGGTLAVSAPWSSSRPLTINPATSTTNPGPSLINAGSNAVTLAPASIAWNGGTLAIQTTGGASLQENGGMISVTPGSALNVTAGTSFAVTGPTDPFTDSSNPANHVAIVNNGSLSIAGVNSSSIAGITGNGTLTVGNGNSFTTLHLAQNSGGSTVGSLAIMANAALDITNNHLIINYGTGTDPITSIQALLISGYNSGAWNGPGINSSTAAANSASYGLGYADSADAGNPAGLASGTIEVAYTLLGDADLNLVVNGIDFGILAANFNKGVTRWDQGNFDYNDVVNGIDFGLLAANFNKGASGADAGATAGDWAALEQFAAANGLLADVPEPGSIALLGLGAAGLLARRRRKTASTN